MVETEFDQQLSILLHLELNDCLSWEDTVNTLEAEMKKQLPERLAKSEEITKQVESVVKEIFSHEGYEASEDTDDDDDE